MMRDRRDARTLELLDWEPPVLVPVPDPVQIRAQSLRDRLSRTIALVLKECGLPRAEIASLMSEWLDEEISEAMLNKYASQASGEHSISAHRLVALAVATDDLRLLQVLTAPLDHAVVPNRYLPAIEEALVTEKIEELTQRQQLARRQWKGPRGK